MSPDGLDTDIQSPWRSIRPWTPPLALNVREITSVSATFILSSDITAELDASLLALGLGSAEDESDDDSAQGSSKSGTESPEPKRRSIISNALAKGLSVNVNGSPWQRVFIRIEDKVDEAVIIIYGLMPGRQYDIDLGLVQGGQNNSIRRQVVTEEVEHENSEVHTDPDSASFDHSTSSDPPLSTPSTSPSATAPNTPPSVSPPLTLEERLNQLQHTLTLINTERDTLTASLKSARRDAQKADAALRSEIDILKRASEKHAAAEHRTKQKILALQEALKRAQTATRETEQRVKEVEDEVPELVKKKAEKEGLHASIKEAADQARNDREDAVEKEKKKLELMRGELMGLTHKMERLNGKKEKLETGLIPDLEEQLREVEREIERTESDSGHVHMSRHEDVMDDITASGTDRADHQMSPNFFPMQRMRNQSITSPGTIGRPPAPIQRPSPGDVSALNTGPHHQLWSTSPPQRQHNARASSLHQQTPILLVNPNRKPSLKTAKITTAAVSNTVPTTSASSSPTALHSAAQASTLSSRAPPFEPGRAIKAAVAGGTNSRYPVPPVSNQRPAGGPVAVASRNIAGNLNASVQPQWTGLYSSYDGGRTG